MSGTVDSIYLASRHGETQRQVEAAKLTAGVGLEGDRYAHLERFLGLLDLLDVLQRHTRALRETRR